MTSQSLRAKEFAFSNETNEGDGTVPGYSVPLGRTETYKDKTQLYDNNLSLRSRVASVVY